MDNLQRVQSVVTAHQILDALAARPGGCSLSELARHLDMTPSRVLRHLGTLVELELIERTGNDPVYRLGIGLVRLATQAANQHEVGRVAIPALRRLHDDTGQAVYLARPQHTSATVWLSFESAGSPRLTMAPGMTFSLSGSACGRAILAFSEPRADLELASQPDDRFPDPIATHDELAERLAAIRQRGYDHYGTDLPNAAFSIAAPVFDHQGCAVGAIGMLGFSLHYHENGDLLLQALVRAAQSVSAQMGYTGPPIAPA
ncbi:IclR family transcriptional regulator [Blastomonas sp. AAP53]|uniref:IclR family transcriptional regulator n=1 Tax=Blastomonas sp. AAP53 TaxID=1248760 RepID=UPI0002D927C2|nr:IclR family transcriptional regulator [Blastomonas sp. AAP53]